MAIMQAVDASAAVLQYEVSYGEVVGAKAQSPAVEEIAAAGAKRRAPQQEEETAGHTEPGTSQPAKKKAKGAAGQAVPVPPATGVKGFRMEVKMVAGKLHGVERQGDKKTKTGTKKGADRNLFESLQGLGYAQLQRVLFLVVVRAIPQILVRAIHNP